MVLNQFILQFSSKLNTLIFNLLSANFAQILH